MPSRIEYMATTATKLSPVSVEDQFEFRPDKKHPRIQRLLFKLLKRWGCFATYQPVEVERHAIDTIDFMRNLVAQDRNLVEHYHHRGEVLLIGPHEYSELTGNPELREVFEFPSQYHRDGCVYGMHIKVIPWMSGMLVMPEKI